LTNACKNYQACYEAGDGGEVGNLKNCCNDFKGCSDF
jgi:hypothetical protein